MLPAERLAYVQRAISDLGLGSSDGIALAEIGARMGGLSLPLLGALLDIFERYTKDKRNAALFAQFKSLKKAALDYLGERAEELRQGREAACEPWSEAADAAAPPQAAKLRAAGEAVRGALVTAKAVVTAAMADPDARRVASSCVGDLVRDGRLIEQALLEVHGPGASDLDAVARAISGLGRAIEGGDAAAAKEALERADRLLREATR